MTHDLRELSEEDAYALGLWCADGYHRSSSIGLSNVDPELIVRFGNYLLSIMPSDRLRLRVYQVGDGAFDSRVTALTTRVSVCPPSKMRRTAYHVYVNSRPLLRLFRQRRDQVDELPDRLIGSYMAGRFDGDGAFGSGRVPGSRIAYSSRKEAEIDAALLKRVGLTHVSVFYYALANEYCIYLKSSNNAPFLQLIADHSTRMDRRRTPKIMEMGWHAFVVGGTRARTLPR